jgi:hypothetical protein
VLYASRENFQSKDEIHKIRNNLKGFRSIQDNVSSIDDSSDDIDLMNGFSVDSGSGQSKSY